MANKKTFMIVLIACGFIQGAIEMYFRISTKQAALTHDYNPRIVGMCVITMFVNYIYVISLPQIGFWCRVGFFKEYLQWLLHIGEIDFTEQLG